MDKGYSDNADKIDSDNAVDSADKIDSDSAVDSADKIDSGNAVDSADKIDSGNTDDADSVCDRRLDSSTTDFPPVCWPKHHTA